MRLALVLALVTLGMRSAAAQVPSRAFSAEDVQWRQLELEYREGRAFRLTGITLTLTGAALVALGLPLFITDPGNEGFPSRAFGGVVMAGGGVAIVSGVPLWLWGSHRMRDARERGYRAWQPFVVPTRDGVIAGATVVGF